MFSSPDWQGGPFVLARAVTPGLQVGKEDMLQRETTLQTTPQMRHNVFAAEIGEMTMSVSKFNLHSKLFYGSLRCW